MKSEHSSGDNPITLKEIKAWLETTDHVHKRIIEHKERSWPLFCVRDANKVKYLIDIIEKQREIIRNDENYLGHARACYSNETRECLCGLIEYLNKRKVMLKLTGE